MYRGGGRGEGLTVVCNLRDGTVVRRLEGLPLESPPSTVETASPMSIVVFTRDGATEIGLRARDSDENRTRACSTDLLPQLRPRSPR